MGAAMLTKDKPFKYVLRCGKCGNNSFDALATGHINCQECCVTYIYIHAVNDWVFAAMDTEELLERKYKKIWDADKQKFLPKKEVLQRQWEKDELKRRKKKGENNRKKDEEG